MASGPRPPRGPRGARGGSRSGMSSEVGDRRDVGNRGQDGYNRDSGYGTRDLRNDLDSLASAGSHGPSGYGSDRSPRPHDDDFQIQVSKLLDVPILSSRDSRSFSSRHGYVVKAFVERDGPCLVSTGVLGAGWRPIAGRDRRTVTVGTEGILVLSANVPMVHLVLEHSSGELIGGCRIHRQDERSRRVEAYALEKQGRPAGCGLELRVLGEYYRPSRSSPSHRMGVSSPSSRRAHVDDTVNPVDEHALDSGSPTSTRPYPLAEGWRVPLGHPQHHGQLGSYPSANGWRLPHTQPQLGFDPRGVCGGGVPQTALEQVAAPFFIVHVRQLLDVPPKFEYPRFHRNPLPFVIRVFDGDGVRELASSVRVPCPLVADDDGQTVLLGPEGMLRVQTQSPLLYVQVDYADGQTLGRCHIHRKDRRSATASAYTLSDPQGSSANCGVELQLIEQGLLGDSSTSNAAIRSGCSGVGCGHPGAGAAGTLFVCILACYNLMGKDGLFKSESDPFVKVRIGKVERKTPTMTNNCNPVWQSGNQFTLPVGSEDGMLEIEVINSNFFKNESLGKANVGLWSVDSGRLVRLRERLHGGANGEIELDVRFDPAYEALKTVTGQQFGQVEKVIMTVLKQPVAVGQKILEIVNMVGVAIGDLVTIDRGFSIEETRRIVGFGSIVLDEPLAYSHAGGARVEITKVGGAQMPQPFPAWMPPHNPPPYPIPGLFSQQVPPRLPEPLESSGTIPLPAVALEPALPLFDMDQDWFADSLPRELEPLAADPVESFLDPMAELWTHEPPPATNFDDLFGLDVDSEVLGAIVEPWRQPVLANHDEPFQDNVFPDMDVRIVLRKSGDPKQGPATRGMDSAQSKRRSQDGLPEFNMAGWTGPTPLKKPKADAKLALKDKAGPASLTVGGRQPASAGKANPAKDDANERRRGKLKMDLEMVQPEQVDQIHDQCMRRPIVELDARLVPSSFDSQVVGCLDLVEEPGMEKQVWVRTPDGVTHPTDDDGSTSWLLPFQMDELVIGITCRRGQRGARDPLPNQDNFSLTRAGDTVLYLLCDGHGPFGHVAAFRVAQSLPKFLFDRLQLASPLARSRERAGRGSSPNPWRDGIGSERTVGASSGSGIRPEHALVQAFEDADSDLATFAGANGVDLSMSGTTCCAVLRMDSDVQVAWLGDSRAIVATVLPDGKTQKVDMVSGAHTCEVLAEAERMQGRGAELRLVPAGPGGRVRLFAPGVRTPCLFPTRALGDQGARRLGLAVQPDIKKMSFSQTPGLVLLTSGGLWDAVEDAGGPGAAAKAGEYLLNLLVRECALRTKGAETAARRLGGKVRDRWEEATEGCSDDATAMILHWTKPAPLSSALTRALSPPRSEVERAQPPVPPTKAQAAPAPAAARGAQITAPRTSAAPYTPVIAATPQTVVSAKRGPMRTKPTVIGFGLDDDVLKSIASQYSGNVTLTNPDSGLLPTNFVVQVVGCLETDKASEAAEAWVLLPTSASGGVVPKRMPLDAAVDRFEALQVQHGGTACRPQVAVQRRRGRSATGETLPNSACFSMTLAREGRAAYVVCDGHGPLGPIVSSRLAQSLPKHLLDGLEGTQPNDDKDVAILAFDTAAADLTSFAEEQGLDLSASGASVVVGLRQGDKVLVSWLGDARALVATVVEENRCRVDLMTRAHTPADIAERRRLDRAGLLTCATPSTSSSSLAAPLRVYPVGTDPKCLDQAPGLSVSRAFGDAAFGKGGVTTSPDLARTSFQTMPGLVMLASGGLCECYLDGDELMDGLLSAGLLRESARPALARLCFDAEGRYTDRIEDLTAVLLHWPPAATAATPGRPQAQAVSSSGVRVAPVAGSVAACSGAKASTSIASGLIAVAGAPRAGPLTVARLQSTVGAAAEAPKLFLQARPQAQRPQEATRQPQTLQGEPRLSPAPEAWSKSATSSPQLALSAAPLSTGSVALSPECRAAALQPRYIQAAPAPASVAARAPAVSQRGPAPVSAAVAAAAAIVALRPAASRRSASLPTVAEELEKEA